METVKELSKYVEQLHQAAKSGSQDDVRKSVTKLFNFDPKNDIDTPNHLGQTALYLACESGNAAAVEALIQAGADLDKQDFVGHAPLHIATVWSKFHIIELLISGDAKINLANSAGSTPLHIAAIRGHTQAANTLIDSGADLVAKNSVANKPLDEAAAKGNSDVFEVIARHMETGTYYSDKVDTLHKAAASGDTKTILNLVVEHEVNVEALSIFGQSALCKAAYYDSIHAAMTLIEVGASVNKMDFDGQTALHYAASGGSSKLVDLLLHKGGRVNIGNRGDNTPLHAAAICGYSEVAKILIDPWKANVNAKNFENKTPRQEAAERGHTDVEILLSHHGGI